MTYEHEKEVLGGLTRQRDNLLETMNNAREMRAELILSNRDKQTDFLQKVGELSFIFGAAIVPVIIVSHNSNTISHIEYVLGAVALYIINGIVALWLVKTSLERDTDDTPLVGLDEEIMTYPVINALNKLLLDLANDKYQKEYWNAANNVTAPSNSNSETTSKPKASFWFDLVIFNFVAASLLAVRAVWPYGVVSYWTIFSVAVLLVIALTTLSYIRTIKNQFVLQNKRETLKVIKSDYQKWFNNDILKKD